MNTIEVTRPELSTYQTDFLYCKERFSVVLACTKSGKTFSHLFWIFQTAMGQNEQWFYKSINPGDEFWWVAPIYKQAKIAFKRLKRKVKGIVGFIVKEGELSIQTPLGSIIAFKGADNPDSLYGEDVKAVIFDEFTRAKQEAWYAIRSTLTATNGPCKFIGNYTGSLNWGYKLSLKAKDNKNYAYFKIDAYDAVEAGILKEEEIEAARDDLPKSIFNALYLVKGSSSGDVLFNTDSLQSLGTNNFVQDGSIRYMTADIALHGSDRFVIGIWHGWVLKKIVSIDKCEAPEVTQTLKDLAKSNRVALSNIIYDADGLGAFLKGYLKQARAFHNGSSAIFPESKNIKPNYFNLKTQCTYEIAKKVNRNEIYIEDTEHAEDVISELEVIRKYELEKGGKLRILPKKDIKKLLGYSPDYADMFIMRYYAELKKSKKGGTMQVVNRRHYSNTQQNRI